MSSNCHWNHGWEPKDNDTQGIIWVWYGFVIKGFQAELSRVLLHSPSWKEIIILSNLFPVHQFHMKLTSGPYSKWISCPLHPKNTLQRKPLALAAFARKHLRWKMAIGRKEILLKSMPIPSSERPKGLCGQLVLMDFFFGKMTAFLLMDYIRLTPWDA